MAGRARKAAAQQARPSGTVREGKQREGSGHENYVCITQWSYFLVGNCVITHYEWVNADK